MTTTKNVVKANEKNNEMSIPIVDFGFKSGYLTAVTATITKAEQIGVASRLIICAQLNNLKVMFDADNKVLTDDGFTNVTDYASKIFGYNKSNTYDMIAVGSKFCDKDGNIVVPELRGFTWTQLNALKTLDIPTIDKLIKDGMTPASSVRDVKKLASKYVEKKPRKARTPKAPKAETTSAPAPETTAAPKAETTAAPKAENTAAPAPQHGVRFALYVHEDGSIYINRSNGWSGKVTDEFRNELWFGALCEEIKPMIVK